MKPDWVIGLKVNGSETDVNGDPYLEYIAAEDSVLAKQIAINAAKARYSSDDVVFFNSIDLSVAPQADVNARGTFMSLVQLDNEMRPYVSNGNGKGNIENKNRNKARSANAASSRHEPVFTTAFEGSSGA